MSAVLFSNGRILADVIDPLNKEGNRTYTNSCWEDYNCMSFAFQKWGVWFQPCGTEYQIHLFRDFYCSDDCDGDDGEIHYTSEEIDIFEEDIYNSISKYNDKYQDYESNTFAYEDIVDNHCYATRVAMALCANNIINAFNEVRIIQDFDEVKDNEYIVAMAGSDRDFHFGVYIPKLNVYCHKMGGFAPEIADSFEEIFGDEYYTPPIYFAVEGSFKNVYEMILEDNMY